jgi:hypothetical protein
MASSSAITTRTDWATSSTSSETIEEFVLRCFQPLDLLPEPVAVPGHTGRVSFGTPVILIRDRCLRDQRPNPRLAGFLLKVDQLLLGYSQVATQSLKAVPDLG